MSLVKLRTVIFLVSMPCGEIQYTAVGLSERDSRGNFEPSTSCGVLSHGSSSEAMLDVVCDLEMFR